MQSKKNNRENKPWYAAGGRSTSTTRGTGALPRRAKSAEAAQPRKEGRAGQNTPSVQSAGQHTGAKSSSALAGCPVHRRCSGCQLQNMSYPEQLHFKQVRTERLLGAFGPILPILGMDKPYHYRNKVQAMFGVDRSRKIISGVYQSATGRIVPVDACLTQDECANRIIVSVRRLLKDFKLLPYDDITGRGLLRHVLVRRGFKSGQVMVVLVVATPIFPAKYNFAKALVKLHPEITTVVMNINSRYDGLMLGEREQALVGPGCIEDELCGLKFRISARSFYQINPDQTERLYQKALDFAALTGTERVLDAYCGIGTIGLIASAHAGEVMGVESNRGAVLDAVANAKRNGVQNCRFRCVDAGDFMRECAAEGERIDVVFMDPPRAGASPEFLQALVTLAPRRVVYISCNPETQARDLAYLTAHGYRALAIQPVDLFPHTNHVETCVKLERTSSI